MSYGFSDIRYGNRLAYRIVNNTFIQFQFVFCSSHSSLTISSSLLFCSLSSSLSLSLILKTPTKNSTTKNEEKPKQTHKVIVYVDSSAHATVLIILASSRIVLQIFSMRVSFIQYWKVRVLSDCPITCKHVQQSDTHGTHSHSHLRRHRT